MSKLTSPAGVHAKNYLATAWKDRELLNESERKGLSQFVYIVALSHLENVLSKIVSARFTTIKVWLLPKDAPDLNIKNESYSKFVSLSPALLSINQLLDSFEKDCESAPLSIITKIFSRLFPAGISKYIGSELNHDLTN